MKILILILCIALARSFPTLGGYQSVDIQQAQSDSQIQSFINDGLQACVADGLKTDQFKSSDFQLTKINSIMQQDDAGEQKYMFDCYFMNDEGYTMRASFNITYDTNNDDTTVTNYAYKVQKGSLIQNVEAQYSQVQYSEFENSQEQQNLVTYGINDMIVRCIAKGYLPDLPYRVQDINWVYRQIYGNSIFYKCNVDMASSGISMNANVTVYYQPVTDNMTVVDYSCDIESQQYGNKDVYVNTATIAPIDSDYIKVPDSELENNAAAKNSLEYGAQQVNKIAVDQGKIPQVDLKIGDVTNAESQIAGNGIYYKFRCKLTDGKTVTVWANYTVYYDAYSGDQDMTNYWYQSEIIGQNNGEQQQQDNEEQLFIPDIETGEFVPGEINFVLFEEEAQITSTEAASEPDQGGLSIFDQTFPLPETSEENIISNNEEGNLIIIINNEEAQLPVENEQEIFIIPPIILEEEGIIIEEESSLASQGYQAINTNQVKSDQKTGAAFQYGVDQVTQQGKNALSIPDYDYAVTDITKAYQKTENNGDSYIFTCQASSEEGSVLWMNFTVFYDDSTQSSSLVSYTYKVKNNAVGESETPTISTEGNYVECSNSEIQSNTVQGVLSYGASQVYGYIQQQNYVSGSDYYIAKINTVYKQEMSGGTSYKCDVVLENNDQQSVDAQYTVYHDDSGQNSLTDYSFSIPNESESSTGNEEASVGEDDLYRNVDLDYLNLDKEYTDMLLYAINAIIQKGYAAEKIPQSQYKISNINYVKEREGQGEDFYKCGVELQDVNKVTIKVTFTASISSSGGKKLWDWSYSVGNTITTPVQNTQVPDSGYTQVNTDQVAYSTEIQDCIIYGVQQIIPNPQDYTLSKINSVYRQVSDSAIYYKFTVQLAGNQKTADLSCTVYYQPDSGQKDVSAYSYTTQTSPSSTNTGSSSYSWWNNASWQSTSGSNPGLSWNSDASYQKITSYQYNTVPVSQVESNQQYKDALNYGVQQCLQNLADNKIISNTNYDVDDVEDAYVQDNGNYKNCLMKVKLSNSQGISLDLDFNVQYQTQGNDMTVTSYSLQGTSPGSNEVLVADYNIADGGQLQIRNCEQVYPNQSAYPQYIQEAIEYGVSQVLDQVAQQENTEESGYKIKDVQNVYQEVVNPNNYRVEATLENSYGSSIECEFMVQYQSNADQKLLSYNYIIY